MVGEFLEWSARSGGAGGGGGAERDARRNFNASSLLRRLLDRLVHPRDEARLGAAHGMIYCAR